MVSDKQWEQWESQEISRWVNNDEYLHGLARQCSTSYGFFETLEMIGISEIGGVKLTYENVKESWEDAND